MKEERRVYLSDMKSRLQARMQYDHVESAFECLLFGFAHSAHYAPGWVGRQRRKGWMTPAVAHKFANYVGYPIDIC